MNGKSTTKMTTTEKTGWNHDVEGGELPTSLSGSVDGEDCLEVCVPV